MSGTVSGVEYERRGPLFIEKSYLIYSSKNVSVFITTQ